MNGGASGGDWVPVVEPTDELPARVAPKARRRIGIVVVVGLCVVAAAIPVTIRMASNRTERKPARTAKRIAPKPARVAVGAALASTIAARNYRIHSLMTQTNAPGSSGQPGLTLSTEATVNVAPLAMVATSNVPGLGLITSWTDGTRQWERGGGNYGLTAGPGIGPGASIAGFGPLVEGTLGPRQAGVAMMGLASPNGHLDVANEAITGASEVGTSTLDGSPLTDYQVTLDLARLVDQPGMTTEQVAAATEGLQLLQQEGFTRNTVRLGVDDAGYVRTAHTVWAFADGGAVTVDTTYYDYGCAGTVVLPTDAPVGPPASTCTSPDPAAAGPPTTGTAPIASATVSAG